MKERPILFSGEMVRAILAGRKTQTRRIIKPQPDDQIDRLHGNRFRTRAPYILTHPETHEGDYGFGFEDENSQWRCPYGRPGDRLWVRETWRTNASFDATAPSKLAHGMCSLDWAASIEELLSQNVTAPLTGRWRPSIHMPRLASRITLEVVNIRVERLQEISEGDALAEGVDWHKCPSFQTMTQIRRSMEGRGFSITIDYVGGYRRLWDSINGPDSWDVNPWVWVVEFKKVQP